MNAPDRPRVVIAGGGVTGLEALLGLRRLAGDRLDVTLVAPEPDFVYKPLLVEEPFALGPAEHHELAPLAKELGASFVQRALAVVRPDDHAVGLDDGSELGYETLVVCVGGRFRAAFEGAITFPAPEPFRVDELLAGGAKDGGRGIAFVVPPGVSWPLPIYELALMTERRARETGVEIECAVITPEASPLVLFGPIASGAVAELLRVRGIQVETGARVHPSNGGFVITPGDRPLEANMIVALPLLDGPRVAGLPGDEGGFIPIDDHARVAGVEDVYAAGDGTNFPIKQGGLGTQQADAAAEQIAARAGAEVDPQPFHPVLRGKLITGDESLHLRHDVTGGGGEGAASADYLWWPPHKISGRYLASWLAHEDPRREPEPPSHPLDVEVALPREWHEEPMALDPYDSPRVD
jgi:sulfide:quinone oxidoreductase